MTLIDQTCTHKFGTRKNWDPNFWSIMCMKILNQDWTGLDRIGTK